MRAVESRRDGNVSDLLIMVRDSAFFKSIPTFLTSYFYQLSQNEMTDIATNLICLLDIYMGRLPTDSAGIVKVIITVLTPELEKLDKVPDIVNEKMQVIKESIEKGNNDKLLMNTTRKRKAEDGFFNVAPPDDFRTLSIFPTASDLEDKKTFLRKNQIDSPYKDLETYLDVQFRLIKEDFVRPLRDGILEYKNCIQTRKKLNCNDVNVYEKTIILNHEITEFGLTYKIQFSLTGALRNVNWAQSKRLIFGSLVCLSYDNFNTSIFATVVNRDPKDLKHGIVEIKLTRAEFDNNNHAPVNLYRDREYNMVESSAFFEAYRHILKSLQETGEDLPFQKYILGSPELAEAKRPKFSVQDSNNANSIPNPTQVEPKPEKKVWIDPPRYLPSDAQYDLTPLMKEEYRREGKNISLLDDSKWPHKDLMTLDDSQLDAIKNALTREVALIQGPPGTGKTYVALKITELLLLNRKFWNRKLGPILVLCYTNHALDQFLEEILKFTQAIIRVGSRGKNEALEKFNFKEVKKNADLPRDIRSRFKRFKATLEEDEQKMFVSNARIEASRTHVLSEKEIRFNMGKAFDNIQRGCRKRNLESCFQEWLELGFVRIQRNSDSEEESDIDKEEELDVYEEEEISIDEDDQKTASYQLKKKKERARDNVKIVPFDNELAKEELSKTSVMNTEERRQAERDPWRLSLPERWRLYRTWVSGYRRHHQNIHESVGKDYIDEKKKLEKLKEDECTYILKDAKIVGMTTSGAARLHSVVKRIESPIMIVEEAAEVLEAHIVANLTPSCQHLILIGDHQQLRPKPTVYELGKKYNLDVSLFERLIMSGLSHDRLNIQHRMQPAISKLIVPHIYKDLQDHESVYAYPAIKGVGSNIFFIAHNQRENVVQDSQSKVNDYEAKFLTELCVYFLKQGYSGERITILTTYSGQMSAFKRLMQSKEFPGVRVTTVDNYQGEENDIILLSLVRSNQEGNIGFLKTDNRVCVALSRAKHALYAIGNFSQLAENSKLWRNIVAYLKQENLIDTSLLLTSGCSHPPYEKVSCLRKTNKIITILASRHWGGHKTEVPRGRLQPSL